tara:strand:+ start:245 stop:403 length:159 start_codon:yes stop_codon:yes gene_type:complete
MKKINKVYRVFYTKNGIAKVSGNFNNIEVAESYAENIIKNGIAQYSKIMVEV